MADYQSLIERKLEPIGRSGSDLIYVCPKCDDESGHLYIDYDKNYWHCFKCGSGGKRLDSLMKYLNIDISYDYDKLYSEQDKELDSIISETKKKREESQSVDYSTDLSILTSYYNQHTKPLSEQAMKYLLDRGLSLYTINRLEIKEGINRYGDKVKCIDKEYVGRDYSDRIMIPSLRKDGLISFYVGRDYTGTREPRYLNTPSELGKASEDVWNLDNVESDSVIICEGVFTAIAASPVKLNSVATYGKSIAQRSSDDSGVSVTSQGEKLLNKQFKNYYVAYDADARDEAIKSCKYLYDRGARVYIIYIDPKKYGPKADIADIAYTDFLKLLSEAVLYDGGLSTL